MSLVDDLLDQARELAKVDKDGRSLAPKARPRQADRRRAVSTAYYALFHAITERSVREILLARDIHGAWGCRLRRTISHATVLKVAKWFVQEKSGSQIPEAVRALRASLSMGAIDRRFSQLCRTIKELQEERHRADYDLEKPFTVTNARRLVMDASVAVSTIRELESEGDARLFFLACIVDITKNS